MHEFIIFTIGGLATASIYAITASGLTLTYATTGIFNWSHGAIGMLAAFAYWRKIRMEEANLAAAFGAAWSDYRRSTGALLPGLF